MNGSLGETMQVLAEEKTLGEASALLLSRFCKTNIETYAQGILLYAEAQAAFNGLIERIKFELGPTTVEEKLLISDQELRAAVARREALLAHVREHAMPKASGDKLGLALGIGDAVKSGVELFKALSEAALKIWQTLRESKTLRQQEIRTQLDAQKWLSFDRIGTAD